jgi:signal transduction histidine kinase
VGGAEEYSFLNVETGERGRSLPRTNAAGLCGMMAFTRDGKLFACALSRTQVQLRHAETFAELAVLESPSPQMISSLAFNSAGTRLAVATGTPFIQLWDLEMVRRALDDLGLDWRPDRPQLEPEVRSQKPPGSLATADTRHPASGLRLLVIGGVLLAMLLAFSVLNRHRKLVESYRHVDELANQRRRALEAAQKELMHGEKMKALGTLAAGIAHDFNNLLSVIRLSNDVIGQEAKKMPGVQEEVQSIENAVQQGRAVVRSMLGYSRDAGDEARSLLD